MGALGRGGIGRRARHIAVAGILCASAAGLGAIPAAGPVAAAGPATTGGHPAPALAAAGPGEVSTAAGGAQPALDVDFPDPTVLVDGGSYYAYSTEVGFLQIQVSSSVDMTNWTPIADALPTLPTWANPFHTWAPSVIRIGSTYVMYYAVQQASSDQQCISRATATLPLGPFTDTSSTPFICQNSLGGSIDPAAFLDTGGNLYLYWKNDGNSMGLPTMIWGQQLSADGSTLVGSAVQMLADGQPWEDGVIEGPGMVAANGTYYLFHSGNLWNTGDAAIGYATCPSPLTPCTEVTASAPWLASEGVAAGPGSPEFFVGTDGSLRMAYHAWNPSRIGYAAGGVRSLWIDRITFTSQGPVAAANGVSTSSASHLGVTGPQSASPGVPFNLTVTALDPTGATDPTYQGTVHFTSTDHAAVLPPDYPFTAADAGVHLFSGVELQTPGAQTVTATDTTTAAIVGSIQVAVAGTPVAAGQTVWSGSGDDVPNAVNPIVVGVTSPQAGTVVFETGQQVELASPGYHPLPWFADVTAPPATAGDPLTLIFRLVSTTVPPSTPGSVSVYKAGTLLDACTGAGTASPDPCVAGEIASDGMIQLTVLSSTGGDWTFGVARLSRLAGGNRIATAVAVSEATYPVPGSAQAAVLARSDAFTDALAGTPLAVAVGGPLLITPPSGLDPTVQVELARLLAPGRTVYILGGTAAISAQTESQVKALGFNVVRYAGADRYGTAVAIADQGLHDPGTVFEATGTNFPDAVAAGAAAAALHGAILLTDGTRPAAATTAYLAAHRPAQRVAVGGPAAAADRAALALVGSDRYATALLLANRYFGSSPQVAGIASGSNWPDALSGGSRVGSFDGPLLLSDPASLPGGVGTFLAAHKLTLASVEIYGGDLALAGQVDLEALAQLS